MYHNAGSKDIQLAWVFPEKQPTPSPPFPPPSPPHPRLQNSESEQASEAVLDWVIANLHRPGDVVHLLHIVPEPRPEVFGRMGSGGPAPDADADQATVKAAASRVHERYVAAKLEPAHITDFKVDILHFATDRSSIGDAISQRAAALPAAAVVMARNEHGRLSQLLLGSTTAYCAKHCPAPLVILRAA